MTKLQAFYRSHKWERLVQTLRFERMTPDGTIICEQCGRPIVSKYDCIGHHAEELTEENVDDAMIALNPSNIILVHFKCHNQIHERFGYAGSLTQRVYIVYGAPCSGKTTWVQSNAEDADLILDIDRIWDAVKADKCGAYQKPDAIKSVVFDIRDCILDDIRTRRGKWRNAYIIGGYPMTSERERLQDRIGADKLIFIDTPHEVCMKRAEQKSPEWCKYVQDWFSRFSPDTSPP